MPDNNPDDNELFRDNLTPGTRDSRFHEPDPGFDYEAAAEDWSGDLTEAEARLDAIEAEAIGEAKSDDGTAEARLLPLLGGGDIKRILFKEPERREEVDTLVRAIAEGNEFVVVRLLIEEPDIYRKRWERQLTPLEQGLLYDLAYSFVRAEELVDPRLIAELGRNG